MPVWTNRFLKKVFISWLPRSKLLCVWLNFYQLVHVGLFRRIVPHAEFDWTLLNSIKNSFQALFVTDDFSLSFFIFIFLTRSGGMGFRMGMGWWWWWRGWGSIGRGRGEVDALAWFRRLVGFYWSRWLKSLSPFWRRRTVNSVSWTETQNEWRVAKEIECCEWRQKTKVEWQQKTIVSGNRKREVSGNKKR